VFLFGELEKKGVWTKHCKRKWCGKRPCFVERSMDSLVVVDFLGDDMPYKREVFFRNLLREKGFKLGGGIFPG
jgi:hypothetical protein